MDQAVADSSSFIQRMKNKDPQQIAYEKTISDFWDTSDVPQGSLPVKIATYPSLESLNEEPKDELTESDYEYYDKKRKILVEKMAIANDVYMAHLQNYAQEDPKNKSQKFLFQFSEIANRLHKQFDLVAERLRLPLEQPLMTYPSLGDLMDAIQQEDMGDRNREYFQEMAKEVKIKEGECPEIPHEENKERKEASLEKRLDPGIGKKDGKNDKKWDSKSPENPIGKKTARWIEEQNEFLGKQKEKEFEKDKKERDPPVFNPNGPVKVLQKPRAAHHTGYEQPPQYLMGAQRNQAPHPPMVETNRGDGSWRSQGKRYPLKERQRTQWGGYGKQYGTSGERRGYQTYETDRTQPQSHNTAYGSQRQGSYFPTKSTGNEQSGNGGGEDKDDKKKYRDMGINHENGSHEESDTEDSYEFEITSQQLSRVTPGGGALKIKLSKKKPLKITAGATDGQSKTIPMELERNWGSKQVVPSSHVDTTSESTLPTRGLGAPLFITPIHPENNEGPQTRTSTKRVNDLKGSTKYGLTKERVTQVQGSNTRKSQGPVRDRDPPGKGGGGDSSGGTSGDQRLPGEGRGPPRRNGNRGGGGGDDDPDPSDDGDGDDSSSTDSSAPRKRKHKSPKYVYVLQGPPGPKGQEGQPGQAGRDGRDGQNLSLTRELEETLKAHRPNLDTTGLENSFDQFGQTIFEVLNAQHRTNQKLEEQFRRANETQEYQAEAMQDMAQANFQMKYDHMFAGVPMYDRTDPDTFDDWLYQIESLCELSHRDVWVELMGRASAQVKRIIRSLPMDIEWEIV